eukprot:403376606
MGNGESIRYNHAEIFEQDPTTGSTIYRNPETKHIKDLWETQDFKINSVYSLFMKARDKFQEHRCLGTKVQIYTKAVQEDAEVQYEYQWKTFDEVYYETQHLAKIILKEGLFNEVFDEEHGIQLQVMGISSVNREEWLISDLAANLLGITTVPLYETLGQSMLQLIMQQTQMQCLFGSIKCLVNILKMIIQSQQVNLQQENEEEMKENIDNNNSKLLQYFLKKVVTFDQPQPQLMELAEQLGIEVISYYDILNKQKQELFHHQRASFKIPEDMLIDHTSLSRKSIFTISYTSGTEKESKGVMLSNENFLSAIANILYVAVEFPFSPEDTYISYLPLAHVFDRLGCYSALSMGAGGIQQQTFVKRMLFQRALASKQYYLEQTGSVNYEVYDRLVFNKIKARLGGKVRIMITASAPIASNVLSFLKCAFCCPIIEAYGQTESGGSSFCTKIFDNQTGHVGGPAVGIEYKLRDVPDMEYFNRVTATNLFSRGEVMLRGPAVFVGYFRNKQLTDQVKTEDGWLHTGDVGMILPEGNTLKIIDRIKNIFKLSQGEYIVSEKLERAYEQSPYIAQIFIYGDSLQSNIVAIIFPELATIKEYYRNQGIEVQDNLTELIELKVVNQLIEDELERLANANQFNSLEKVRKNFRLVDKEFEVGVTLTPTMKLRRAVAREVYKEQIQDIYSKVASNVGQSVKNEIKTNDNVINV